MKSYTPSLMNLQRKRPKFWDILRGKPFDTGYYMADHKEKDIHIMWVEASQFGPTYCYPCVLEVDGEVWAFHGTGSAKKAFNDELIREWNKHISPDIMDQFNIEEKTQEDFYELLEVRAVPKEYRAEAEEYYAKQRAMMAEAEARKAEADKVIQAAEEKDKK